MATGVPPSRTFTNENHANSVLQNLNEQRSSLRFCDVILRVGKNEVYAHSNILAAASPYFGTFLGHGQDHPRAFSQKSPQIIEIHIDGNGDNTGYADAVSLIVSYMYSNKLELVAKFLVQVVEIAKIMQMDKVLEYCKQFETGEVENSMPDTQGKICKKDIAIQTVNSIPYFPAESDVAELHDNVKDQKICLPEKKSSYSKNMNVNVMTKSVIVKEESDEPLMPDKEIKLKEKTNKTDNQNKNSVVKQRRGRPSKASSRKTLINEIKNCEASIQTDFVSDTSEDDSPDFEKSVSNKKSDHSYITEGKLPVRKNRGKKPSKFLDDAESDHADSDALVVDETDETEQPPPFKKAKLLTCEDCPYTTYVEYHFSRHVQAHNSEPKRTYQCNQCDFKAPKMKELHEHIRDHMHEKNICSFCDLDFEDKKSLVDHLQTHEPPNPYYCNYCGAKYRTRAQLNVHLPKHLNTKPFVCEICQAGFKWKHALKCHMATHSTTKEHLCDVCGFSTAHKSQLKAHKLIHTGDTFKCEYPNCKFQSIRKQSLKYHMLSHTQEKPHQCEICGQSFSLTKNLKRHSLLHTDFRPYKCDVNDKCNFSTTRFDKLKEHKLKIHGSGEAPGKKFRLSDYPKSLVPPDDHEIVEATDRVQNIIRIGNSNLNLNQIQGNDLETKVYIQQPGGDPIPVTLVASKFEIPYNIGQFIAKLEN